MKRVIGVGGIFFKAKDPKRVREWYSRHLGMRSDEYGTNFESRHADDPDKKSFLLWSPFKESTDYFKPSEKEFMINFRVENLEALLEVLASEGVELVGEVQSFEYGKFAHILDPEGNKIELWEPNAAAYDAMIKDARTF